MRRASPPKRRAGPSPCKQHLKGYFEHFYFFCFINILKFQVNYKPISIQKFDTQIEVLVRGWKPIYLRMGGHVEAPCVDIDMVSQDCIVLICLDQ